MVCENTVEQVARATLAMLVEAQDAGHSLLLRIDGGMLVPLRKRQLRCLGHLDRMRLPSHLGRCWYGMPLKTCAYFQTKHIR